MVLEIPLDSSVSEFRQITELGGVVYVLEFSWSDRSASWYMSLFLQTEGEPDPIVTGLRLSCGYPLLIGVQHDSRPPGDLFMWDTNSQGDAGREDLGTRVRLLYYDLESLSV